MPLPIHAHALQAAETAECGRRQGKYWEMHQRLFASPPALDQAALANDAGIAGLDRTLFDACLAGDAAAAVQADVAQGKEVGVVGTPAFLIGVVLPDGSVKALHALRGALPLDRFRQALDDALAAPVSAAR
jgi:predicted DsbA family dithiol-disulfide isomerase